MHRSGNTVNYYHRIDLNIHKPDVLYLFPDNRNNINIRWCLDKSLLRWLLDILGHKIFFNPKSAHRNRNHRFHRRLLRMLRGGEGKLLHGRHGKHQHEFKKNIYYTAMHFYSSRRC